MSNGGAEGFDLKTMIDWNKAKEIGLHNHIMSKNGPSPTCGKFLAHCKEKITSFREKVGIRLCIFKIGVTSDPCPRYELYREKGYTMMWLIAATSSIDLLHMLEAALISEFHQHVGCRNSKNTGGEGKLNGASVPPPPYFLYVVGGRADQGRWLG